MKLRYKDSLASTVNFYKSLQPTSLRDDFFGLALKHKTGLPARRAIYGKSPSLAKLLPEAYSQFFERYREIYIVPLDDFAGNIFGFLFRAVEEKAFRVQPGAAAVFYGLQDFKGFSFDKSIVMVEGIKDAEAFKRFNYPYTLAILSSSLSKVQWEVIKRMTKRPVYIGDNDFFGRLHTNRMRREFNFEGYIPPEKDLGVLWERESSSLENFIQGVVTLVK